MLALHLFTFLPCATSLFFASGIPTADLFPKSLDSHLLLNLRTNELMAEQVGYAALLEEECSMVKLCKWGHVIFVFLSLVFAVYGRGIG